MQVLKVPPEAWGFLVSRDLLEPKEIPASKVRLALLGQLERRVPLDLRVYRALRATQALPVLRAG